jgi:hypothetical protein
MRARITTLCPSCRRQIIARVRFPTAAHRDVKVPVLEEWEHSEGCVVGERDVRGLFGLGKEDASPG